MLLMVFLKTGFQGNDFFDFLIQVAQLLHGPIRDHFSYSLNSLKGVK